jgi:uncharacterized SAM-binding protein YcdF (DUF218 family)
MQRRTAHVQHNSGGVAIAEDVCRVRREDGYWGLRDMPWSLCQLRIGLQCRGRRLLSMSPTPASSPKRHFTLPKRRKRPAKRRQTGRRVWLWRLLGMVLLLALGWFGWLYLAINAVADHDEARPADAIAVFGAAEYGGRPSPVLHARLDHAVELYQEQMAPLVITLGGGSELDKGKTEGGVGRDYLLANGVPYEQIVAETHSVDTEQQVRRLAEIARERRLKRIVVVSDGTHLFRVRKLCQDAGLTVYTSPRGPLGHIDDYDLALRYFHEMLSYTLLRLHLNFGWLHGRVDA